MTYQVGEQKILKKPTFIYKGVIVLQNSPVRIKAIVQKGTETFYTIEYIDKEGNIMLIENIKQEELV